ncbi:hypothetical protein PGT21_021645 [Puccinia graminis f. sp. tritici]|uniref:Uncharacterized protein n=1 Tax=Puccinia graminis f. sp. tritici TaxID=56615 RepID=A0A5B0NV63_PUCGR|nr:hypothetical protein PGT21_021645 [Puccinia graminis f. sp. tritici]KAA1091728.1 hypothetical protein PGTUg99_006184 [Puccinia graminis f. sp. tritici]
MSGKTCGKAHVSEKVCRRLKQRRRLGPNWQQCGWHFSPTSSKPGKSSCKQTDDADHLCWYNSCSTSKGGGRWEDVFFVDCYVPKTDTKSQYLKPAQYYRYDKDARVQEAGTGTWFTCPYGDIAGRNDQVMNCSGCEKSPGSSPS